MYVVMTNPTGELLSEIQDVTEADRFTLNQELKVRQSENRYLRCSQAGVIDARHLNASFMVARAKAAGTYKTPQRTNKTKKAARVQQEDNSRYFILAKNNGDNSGFACIEAGTEVEAQEKVRERLGKELIIIKGTRLNVKVSLQ